jgi:hypothetical protein
MAASMTRIVMLRLMWLFNSTTWLYITYVWLVLETCMRSWGVGGGAYIDKIHILYTSTTFMHVMKRTLIANWTHTFAIS